MLKSFTVWMTTNWKILGDENTRPPYLSPEKPVGQEATVRTRHGIADQFQIGKGAQGCILLPCLFYLYVECVV